MSERDESLDLPPDPVLDKHLLALQRFTPKTGFEDRVMARVRIPAPALAKVQTKVRRFASPARLWWASGLAAASSAAWTVALASWLSGVQTELVMTWLNVRIGQPLLAAALQWSAIASKALSAMVLSAYASLGNTLYLAVAVLMLLPVLSSWGLYLTMKQSRGKRVMAYAA